MVLRGAREGEGGGVPEDGVLTAGRSEEAGDGRRPAEEARPAEVAGGEGEGGLGSGGIGRPARRRRGRPRLGRARAARRGRRVAAGGEQRGRRKIGQPAGVGEGSVRVLSKFARMKGIGEKRRRL